MYLYTKSNRKDLLRGVVFDIKRLSTDDGPGIRTTVFLKGCPLSCKWCHSPESISPKPQLAFYKNRCIGCGKCAKICPEEAQIVSETERRVEWEGCTNCGECVKVCPSMALKMVGEWVGVEQIMQEIRRDFIYYQNSGGGVTLSGGEPLAQPSFTLSLLKQCKEESIHTSLDTSGFARWSVLSGIIPYVDLFLYDLKYYADKTHSELTRVSNKRILANLVKLVRCGKRVEVRVPVIPGYTDCQEDIYQRAKFVKLLGINRISFLPYNEAAGSKYHIIGKKYELESTKSLSQEEMEEIKKFLIGRNGLEDLEVK